MILEPKLRVEKPYEIKGLLRTTPNDSQFTYLQTKGNDRQ